ncbi:MAG: hemerythrin domain-containing protein [Bacteroidetes bacterium]|nr:hemerythrin domain-containing protein [Bacteroidota bacterium]
MITQNDKLAEVLSRNINLLPIIVRFGAHSNIGQESIKAICSGKGIDLAFFLSVINTYNSSEYFPNGDFIDLGLLVDFLTKTHDYHKIVTIPRLQSLIKELKTKLPDKKLSTILEKYFNEYVERLLNHIKFEEDFIFPLVKMGVKEQQKESLKKLKKLFSQHTNVETEINDLIVVIIQHIPEYSDEQLFFEILHTLTHFELEQIDHARFEDKILVPRLLRLLTHEEH